MTRTLILGVNGQDGSYLADLLLARGDEVHGLHRHSSNPRHLWRIEHCRDRLTLHQGDVLDTASVARVIDEVRPEVIYNEADQDHVDYSFRAPGYSLDVTAGAVVRMLEAVRQIDVRIRWFQPLSATMFGDADWPQNEGTPLAPMSPYACAKASALHVCRFYRKAYGMHVTTGILYGHDSPRRGPDYLLQRIARQAVAVARDEQSRVELWGEDTVVDIGHAREFMETAVSLMGLEQLGDYVVGTGAAQSISSIVEAALVRAGTWPDRYSLGGRRARPGRAPTLVADCTHLRAALGADAQPERAARDVVSELVDHLQGRIPA